MEKELFLVCWSGGYECPSYMIFDDLNKANLIFDELNEEASIEDYVQILKLDINNLEAVIYASS